MENTKFLGRGEIFTEENTGYCSQRNSLWRIAFAVLIIIPREKNMAKNNYKQITTV